MGLSLTRKEIRFYLPEIEAEFEALTNHPWFSGRRNSKQWQFLRHCFEVLMERRVGDFDCGPKEAVNYKFEVSERLQRYYLHFGKPIKFIFQVESVKKEGVAELSDASYPACNGYYLRVFFNKDRPDDIQLRKLLIEKTVSRAIDAEFAAYESLPDVNIERLDKVFDKNGSAFKRILNVLNAHQKRGWILGNPQNPSTKRLVDVRIKEMTENFAEVSTTEYWLLMWWGVKEKKYAHIYNETNRQTYFLVRKKKNWVVTDNPYAKPRTSTPRRNIRHFQAGGSKGVA